MNDVSLEVAPRVKPDPIDPRARAYAPIDTDFHFSPRWSDVRKHLKEPHRTLLAEYPDVGREYSPKYAMGNDTGGRDTQGTALNAKEIIDVLDRIGVETVIISPGYQRTQNMFHPPMVEAVAAAYNDFLEQEILPYSSRLRAEIALSQINPEAGAEEIERRSSNPSFVSIYTEFSGSNEPIGSAKHDPIFAAAAKNDLVVTMHVGNFWQHATPIARGVRTWTELAGIAAVATCMTYVSSMIMQGLFDKFPELRIAVKEGGFWWLPEFMARADDYYLNHPGDIRMVERKLESGERFLRKSPSEYIKSNFRFSSQPMCFPPRPEHFKLLMAACDGEDMLMYSSDWPHATFDPVNWLFAGALDDKARQKILHSNAAAWYPRLRLGASSADGAR